MFFRLKYIFPLLLFLFIFCVPVEDLFIKNVLRNYKKNGFLHQDLLQVNCKADLPNLNLPYKKRLIKNKEAAVFFCREKLAVFLADFFLNEKLVSDKQNKELIGNYSLKQKEALMKDFKSLLASSYIAYEKHLPNGGVMLTMRLYKRNLPRKVIHTKISLLYKRQR